MSISIRPIRRGDEGEVAEAAERMRATLVEVLGPERGEAMYTMAWLCERVRWHLEREAEVLIAERESETLGHVIVRIEEGERGREGLISTVYVAPAARRRGVARQLVARAEVWLLERGVTRSAYCTASDNDRVIALFEARGYAITVREGDMVRLEGTIGSLTP